MFWKYKNGSFQGQSSQTKAKEHHVCYVVQCSNVSSDIYIRETKHPFHKCMVQGELPQQNKTQLYTCFKGEKTVFWGCQGSHFGGERPFERTVKEGIYIRCEWPLFNRGYDLQLSDSLPKHLNLDSHLFSRDLNSSHDSGERDFTPWTRCEISKGDNQN